MNRSTDAGAEGIVKNIRSYLADDCNTGALRLASVYRGSNSSDGSPIQMKLDNYIFPFFLRFFI